MRGAHSFEIPVYDVLPVEVCEAFGDVEELEERISAASPAVY